MLSMVVCCANSDGKSCSGVFINCMMETERIKVEGGVDIFQTVKAARAQRPHMVYTRVSPVKVYIYICIIIVIIQLDFIQMVIHGLCLSACTLTIGLTLLK